MAANVSVTYNTDLSISNAFTMTVSGAFPTISLSGFAFAKNSKSGVFGAEGDSATSDVVLVGKFKADKTGIVKSLRGSFTAVFNDGVDQCVYVGKFKVK